MPLFATPTVAARPLCDFGVGEALALPPPPPQPASATATSGNAARVASDAMDVLRVMVTPSVERDVPRPWSGVNRGPSARPAAIPGTRQPEPGIPVRPHPAQPEATERESSDGARRLLLRRGSTSGRAAVEDLANRVGRQLRLRQESCRGALGDEIGEVGLRMGRDQDHRRPAAAVALD
jgi:hypothetical protein